MKPYILLFNGKGPKPPNDVDRIKNLDGVTIVDESVSSMLLIEAIRLDGLKELLQHELPNWSIAPVRKIPHPDGRVRIKRGPSGGQGNDSPSIPSI